MLMSEKISIIAILWVLIVLVFVKDNDIEIFFIFIIIGTLAIKMFTSMYLTKKFKFRFNLFILMYLLTFIVIIANKALQQSVI